VRIRALRSRIGMMARITFNYPGEIANGMP
jgi:hypothetical protein